MTPTRIDPAALQARCEREIFDLHTFFERWFVGDLPAEAGVFTRLANALAKDFRYILPSGKLLRRKEVLDGLFAAHGTNRAARIEIRNLIFPAAPEGALALVFFEEHQWLDGVYEPRFNTALMRCQPGAPEGVAWLHLHETTQARTGDSLPQS